MEVEPSLTAFSLKLLASRFIPPEVAEKIDAKRDDRLRASLR
jgi:hypothetical protein